MPTRRLNLPTEYDAFFGRKAELGRLSELLAEHRLVSVVGLGGAGKTRLVTRFASLHEGDDVVAFCKLSSATDLDGIVSDVIGALDLSTSGGASIDGLAEAVRGLGSCVLILDNVEQVVEPARRVVARLLDGAPGCRILVTSRKPLALKAERVMRLESLHPDDAVLLFTERARARHPDLDSEELATVLDRVVRRLDAIPLAIEMAAGRMGLMTPEELLQRLDESAVTLERPTFDGTARHATMEAAMAWSWELLEPAEQSVLTALTVFEDGFDLAAAEDVCGDEESSVAAILQGILQQSLVRRVPADDVGRFALYGPVRDFARNRLDGDRRSELERKHARVYADRFAEIRGGGGGPDTANLVRAFGRFAGREPQFAAELALACYRALRSSGEFRRMHDILDTAIARPSDDDQVMAKLYGARAICRVNLGRLADARDDVRIGLERTAADDVRSRVFLLVTHASILRRLGSTASALADTCEALELVATLDDPWLHCVVSGHVANALYEHGSWEECRKALDRTDQLIAEAQNGDIEAYSLVARARLETRLGRPGAGLKFAQRAVELHAGNDRRFDYLAHLQVGRSLLELGRVEEAEAALRRPIENDRTIGDRQAQVGVLLALADCSHEPDVAFRQVLEIVRGTDDHLTKARASMLLAVASDDEDDRAHYSAVLRAATDAVDVAALRELTGFVLMALNQESTPPDVERLEPLAPVSTAMAERPARAATKEADELRGLLGAASDEFAADPSPDFAAWDGFDPYAVAARAFEKWLEAARDDGRHRLYVRRDGGEFSAPGSSEYVDISSRAAPARILAALAQLRAEHPGESLDTPDILEAGWPGDFVTEEAGASRVYTAIRTLRKAGLADALVTGDDGGYLLDPDLPFAWTD